MAFTPFPAATPPTPITSLTEKVTPIGADEIQISDSEDSDLPKKVQLANLPYPPSSGGAPTGTVLAFAGTAAPADHLMCDGSVVSRTTYAGLYAVIGDAFGNGDGSTTFHLPDMRGNFIRGTANGQGSDPDRATRISSGPGGNIGDNVGSFQGDEVKGHGHVLKGSTTNGNDPFTATNYFGYRDEQSHRNMFSSTNINNTNVIGNSAGSESRPKNIGMNHIIKT
jgi:microcystin-dependent protein